jgi:hypothetical protein
MLMFSGAQKRLVRGPAALGRVRCDAEISVVQSGRPRLLLDYCEARRVGRFVPRAAIRPRELLPLLPHLFIAQLGLNDAQYRLGGTALVSRLGVEVTGKTVREIFEPVTAERILHTFRSMAASGRSMSWRGHYCVGGTDSQAADVVGIPVLYGTRDVQIFGGIFF